MGIRQKFADLVPDWLYAMVAVPYWALHPYRESCIVLPYRDCWLIVRRGVKFFAPSPEIVAQNAYLLDYKSLYLNENFNVQYGDVVCDCGACIGGFTASIVDKASTVVAIEPEPRNLICLRRNVAGLQNVIIVDKALWDCKGTLELYAAKDILGHSLFTSATKDAKLQSVKVQADTLDNIIGNLGIQKVDFIKMNIEGAELEVLRGAKEVLKTTKKVVVEAHHRREGKETSSRVRRFLEDNDFSTYVSPEHIVYAWKYKGT